MKRVVILTLALATMGPLGAAADKPNFSGVWTLDAAKSNFGQTPPPASLTRKVEQNGASVSVVQTQTGGPGGEVTVTANYSPDGEPTTNKFRGADSKSTAKWDGDALTIITNTKLQNIAITVTERWTLSDDGKILTIAQNTALPQGQFGVTYVLNKAPDGAALYKERCATCHDNPQVQIRMPSREEIAARTPEAVMNAMFSGAMVTQAAGLTQEEGRAIALYLTGKKFVTASETTAGKCTAPLKAFAPDAKADWNGWGVDPTNSRFQPNPGFSVADVPRLKLKWAFGYPNEFLAFAQPTVVGGRIFVGTLMGNVYSLDASSGCTIWSFNAGAGVRTAITVAAAKTPGKYIAFFGDLRASAHALDAETGQELWKTTVDDHRAAALTGAPALYNGTLYVPVSSSEEVSAASNNYDCCTFRGSLVALDAETGKQLWKSYTVVSPPKPFKKNSAGTQQYGPAGAAVWSAATIDAKRKLIYVATGDSYTDVDVNTSDAIIAYSLETGKLQWISQVEQKDNFVNGCPRSANCPESDGPDYDFGASVILRDIGGGKQVLLAGQKSGILWGLDPDNKGKILWQLKLGAGSALGGIEWGPAADSMYAYVAISDRIAKSGAQPGISAVNFATGKKVWTTPAPAVTCVVPAGCAPGQAAAVSVIPGAVFSGALNGHFRAYATADGKILWDFDTATNFDTVNKVAAKGGSVDGPGPAIANGIVLTNSGYGAFGGKPGNVLLAFTVDGK
jgi:polyvinyl alcohol dehydrogenase (cytochrome)